MNEKIQDIENEYYRRIGVRTLYGLDLKEYERLRCLR